MMLKELKKELKNRNLSKDAEEARLQEIDEHIKEYSQNEDLRKQFDYEFINDYTEGSKNKLIEIIKQEALKKKLQSNRGYNLILKRKDEL